MVVGYKRAPRSVGARECAVSPSEVTFQAASCWATCQYGLKVGDPLLPSVTSYATSGGRTRSKRCPSSSVKLFGHESESFDTRKIGGLPKFDQRVDKFAAACPKT